MLGLVEASLGIKKEAAKHQHHNNTSASHRRLTRADTISRKGSIHHRVKVWSNKADNLLLGSQEPTETHTNNIVY